MSIALEGSDRLISQTVDQMQSIGEGYHARERYNELLSTLHKIQDSDNVIVRKLKDISNYLGRVSHSYHIFNIPIINYGILSMFGYLLVKLSFRYHQLYTRSSIMATIATNVVLYGISDTCAQSIAMFNENRSNTRESVGVRAGSNWLRSRGANGANRVQVTLDNVYSDDPETGHQADTSNMFVDYGDGESIYEEETANEPFIINLEQSGNDRPSVGQEGSTALERATGTRFNFRRFFGFITWGFIMAFVQVVWYLFLNAMFNDMPTIVTILERDLTDQLLFSPISLACFFAYSTLVIEGKNMDAYKEKMFKLYITTYAVSFSVWFPVQFINFAVMPKKFQVPFSSGVGVVWNCFLSYRNAKTSTELEESG